MPLMRFDILEGRTDSELKTLLDAAHEAMLEAFNVPPGDRYQIVTEHKPSRMIVEDTGLDIPRTKDVVVVQMITRPRAKEKKQLFLQAADREARSRLRHRPGRRHGLHGGEHRRGLVLRPRPGAVPHRRTLTIV